MFPGLKERLSKELIAMVPEGVEVKVVAPPERIYSSLTSVWVGGSIFPSLKTIGIMWVTSGRVDLFHKIQASPPSSEICCTFFQIRSTLAFKFELTF